MISLEKTQEIVNETLRDFLAEQKHAAQLIHPSYVRLYDEIERVIFAGGKRLRPHLVFLGYGGYDPSVAKVAAAHELLHVALLIHDDIIDRDTLRHGQATIHHKYNVVHYAPFINNSSDRHHFSTSAALLAGDLMISSAYELIRQADLDKQKSQAVTQLMSTGIFEVAGGELLDTEASFIPDDHMPLLVYRYKTTGYSFIAPLLTGAFLSDETHPEDIEKLRDYATNLGIAYQIKDDYLGVFGETAKTGKSTLGDLREGKQTVLIAEFKKKSTQEQRELFDKTFGQTVATDEELQLLKGSIYDSGALEEATNLEKGYVDTAVVAATEIKNPTLRENLLDLVRFLNGRTA